MGRWVAELGDGAAGMKLAAAQLTLALGGTVGSADRPASPVELAPDVFVPARFSARFYDADTGTVAELEIVIEDGAPLVEALQLTAGEGDRNGIDRDRLRGVPTADLLRRACADIAHVGEDGSVIAGQRAAEQARSSVPGARTDITTAYLRRVAEVYNAHDGPAPRQAVARQFNVSPSAAGKHIMRAREEGLLPPTRPGVATNREDTS